jgi:phosphate transport system substrate-binding protein
MPSMLVDCAGAGSEVVDRLVIRMLHISRVAALGLCLSAAALFLPHAHAEQMKVGGTGAGLALMKILAEAFKKTEPGVEIAVLPSLGSSGGLRALAAGKIQMAVSARALKPKERDAGLSAVEIGRTPFVFAVGAANSAEEISLQQLVDIYAGKLTEWPNGERIRIVLRPKHDSDSALVRSLSPEMAAAKKQAEDRKGMLFAVTDQDNQDNLERMSGAIGATSLGQIIAEKRKLKPLVLDGIKPDIENLAAGRYPLSKSLFVVIGPNAADVVRRFRDFMRSSEGRDILRNAGFWIP